VNTNLVPEDAAVGADIMRIEQSKIEAVLVASRRLSHGPGYSFASGRQKPQMKKYRRKLCVSTENHNI
jgi:hypothetical protein